MQKDKKLGLVELYRKKGLLFPANTNDILAFENSNDINGENPSDWDNPVEILKRGKISKLEIKSINLSDESISNLSVAAREGKEITEEIRKRMENDREQSKKRQ